ncbi:hypothetical protein BHE74_00052445 [Ensete ventricosum]|nr:hypothetical protein BHE74_00052445 [Ensete ventricosum]
MLLASTVAISHYHLYPNVAASPYSPCSRHHPSPLATHAASTIVVVAFFSTCTNNVTALHVAASTSPSAFFLPQNRASTPLSLANRYFLTRSHYLQATTSPLPSTPIVPSSSFVPNHSPLSSTTAM